MRFLFISLLSLCLGLQTQAQETSKKEKTPVSVTAAADFGSAYVFRGSTFNEGAVFQPWVSISKGWFNYTLWNNININGPKNDPDAFDKRGQSTEVDNLFTFSAPFIKFMDVSTTFAFFTYPTLADKGETEWQISLSKAVHPLLTPYASTHYMLRGGPQGRFYTKFGIKGGDQICEKFSLDYQLFADWENAAHLEGNEKGIRYWQAKVGANYAYNDTWGISASMNYVDQIDKNLLSDKAYDVKFFGKIGLYVNL